MLPAGDRGYARHPSLKLLATDFGMQAEEAFGVVNPASLETSALRELPVGDDGPQHPSELRVPFAVLPLGAEEFEDGFEVAAVVERGVGFSHVFPPPPPDGSFHHSFDHYRRGDTEVDVDTFIRSELEG